MKSMLRAWRPPDSNLVPEAALVTESSSCPLTGSGAQPWIVEPTRAGWWWWLDKRTGQIELVRVKNFGTPWAPHLSAYGDGWGGWTIPLMNEHKPGWWAGPVEPPETPREEPRPRKARLDNHQTIRDAVTP